MQHQIKKYHLLIDLKSASRQCYLTMGPKRVVGCADLPRFESLFPGIQERLQVHVPTLGR